MVSIIQNILLYILYSIVLQGREQSTGGEVHGKPVVKTNRSIQNVLSPESESATGTSLPDATQDAYFKNPPTEVNPLSHNIKDPDLDTKVNISLNAINSDEKDGECSHNGTQDGYFKLQMTYIGNCDLLTTTNDSFVYQTLQKSIARAFNATACDIIISNFTCTYNLVIESYINHLNLNYADIDDLLYQKELTIKLSGVRFILFDYSSPKSKIFVYRHDAEFMKDVKLIAIYLTVILAIIFIFGTGFIFSCSELVTKKREHDHNKYQNYIIQAFDENPKNEIIYTTKDISKGLPNLNDEQYYSDSFSEDSFQEYEVNEYDNLLEIEQDVSVEKNSPLTVMDIKDNQNKGLYGSAEKNTPLTATTNVLDIKDEQDKDGFALTSFANFNSIVQRGNEAIGVTRVEFEGDAPLSFKFETDL